MAGATSIESLAAMFEASAANRTVFDFVDGDGEVALADVLGRCGRATNWFDQFDSVATVLIPSPDALALLVAASRASCRLVSIPTPPRGLGSDRYLPWVIDALEATDATALVVPREYLGVASAAVGDRAFALDEVLAGRGGGGRSCSHTDGAFELVQFTSGTTGPARGVRISETAILANAAAIIDAIDPRPGATVVSWLPWSHDMGLIGTLLAGVWATATRVTDGRLVMMRPESYIRQPATWLRACSDYRAEVTAAPDFALRQARDSFSRRDSVVPLDLSALRTCLTGGEMVRARTLAEFAATFEPAGFDATALCPAYGLAEATLAVSMSRPGDPWRVRSLTDPLTNQPGELVSAGPPLAGCEVRSNAATGHRVEVRTAARFSGYTSGHNPEPASEWMTTSDHGLVVDGELHIAGRSDDVLVVAGRNINATVVDATAQTAGNLRPGTATGVADPDGSGYVLVCEVADGAPDLRSTAGEIRRALVAAVDVGPNRVVFLERGDVPRTASGKPRRHLLAGLVANDDLPVVAVHGARTGGVQP